MAHPALYIAGLFGPRPVEPGAVADWDRRARTVEAWRHHHLGHGQPAARLDATPSEQAFGSIPDDAIDALTRRQVVELCQSTLDLGLSR
jgi:hypothetical protein